MIFHNIALFSFFVAFKLSNFEKGDRIARLTCFLTVNVITASCVCH